MSVLGFSELYIGTEVTFTTLSPQKWVIEEKLIEDVQQMTRKRTEYQRPEVKLTNRPKGLEAIWMGARHAWIREHNLWRGYADDNKMTILRHIAGFRESASLDPEVKFTDMTFVGWGLAIAPRKAGWEKDSTKWTW
ncbi:hypothetical protein N7447_004754 [Penicillium robsamsonii]|uniref:uncharacterized protein n=1 Tax=Penicillium robsamsonii TaxID=1792511 RepID=UPI00254746D6|nr:uncharacterized protein N7447_004754 [Penicillium robsamsonii]KAJ5822414.1 hypothetical protein N7447_004754 [Penicillium robsamsonii]